MNKNDIEEKASNIWETVKGASIQSMCSNAYKQGVQDLVQNEETYKVLEFIDGRRKTIGKYVHIIQIMNDTTLYGGTIPQLVSSETTLEQLIEIYPNIDFTGVVLREIKLY